jgi:hypothetical protein
MALTYDYTKVAGVDKFTDEQHENASQLAWVMMTLQLRDITEKNLDEVLFRIKFLEEINVKLFQEQHSFESVKKYITDHINYETNVGNESRYKFITHWAKVKASIVEDKLKVKEVN